MTDTKPTLEEQIEFAIGEYQDAERNLFDDACRNISAILASLEKLAALESQPVPVEPGFLPVMRKLADKNLSCSADVILIRYIDSLKSALRVESATVETLTKTVESFQSALKLAQENHKAAEQNVSDLMAEVAQTGALLMKAESLNRRMVELLKRPPDEYLNISDIWSKSCDDVEGCHLGHPTQQHYFADLLHKAMSAELLKEATK